MKEFKLRPYFLILILLAGLCPACSKSTSTPDKKPELRTIIDPFEANSLLAKSVNLGNALEAPAEGEWGVVLREEYFQLIKQAGFTGVRVPIRWSAHAAVDSPYTIDRSFFDRIDWVLHQARSNDLAVVINIHHYEELFSEPAKHRARFLALWRQIAARYREQDPEVMFEILNEPHDGLTAQLWNQYLVEALQMIRESNPDRTVIVGTAEWGGISKLNALELPAEETNLIVTVHYYNPFHFTHQGAEWVSGSDAWLGTRWTASGSEKKAVDDDFNQVMNWSSQHNRPVFLGEFGSYSKADMDSRYLWTRYVREACEKRGFAWSYWEFAAGFGIYDPVKKEWREPLLQALIPGE